MNETSHFIVGGPLVFSSVFLLLMIKRRGKAGGKAFLLFSLINSYGVDKKSELNYRLQ